MSGLYLTLVPSLSCNLKCPYCYEPSFRIRAVGRKKYNRAVCNYLKNASRWAKSINIDWFGGEPLLNLNSIEQISSCASTIWRPDKIRSSIITNASFINSKIERTLSTSNINSLQITLDNDHKTHSRMRKGSFDDMVKFINYATNACSIRKIWLRVHCHGNIKDYISTMRYLQKTISFEKITIYYKDIFGCNEYIYNDITSKNYEKIHNIEFSNLKLMASSCHSCKVMHPNHYVILPDLTLAKCTVHLNSPTNHVGVLEDSGRMILDKNMIASCLSFYLNKTTCAFST